MDPIIFLLTFFYILIGMIVNNFIGEKDYMNIVIIFLWPIVLILKLFCFTFIKIYSYFKN